MLWCSISMSWARTLIKNYREAHLGTSLLRFLVFTRNTTSKCFFPFFCLKYIENNPQLTG